MPEEYFSFENLLNKVTPQTLWIVFAVFVCGIIIISLILFYHWKKYRFQAPLIGKMQVIYFIGVAVLLVVSAISLSMYTF